VDTPWHFTRFVAEFLRTFKAKGDQTDSERAHLTRILTKPSQTRKDAQAEATLERVLREKRDAQQNREEMKRLKVTIFAQKERLESERNVACGRSTSHSRSGTWSSPCRTELRHTADLTSR
jgi:hypothetical protein